MSSIVELKMTYNEQTKWIVYQSHLSLDEFYNEVKSKFGIEGPIRFMEADAEITHKDSLYHGRKLIVELASVPLLPIVSQANSQSVNAASSPLINEINGEDLIDKVYFKKGLLIQVNEWAAPKRVQSHWKRWDQNVNEGCILKNCNLLKPRLSI